MVTTVTVKTATETAEVRTGTTARGTIRGPVRPRGMPAAAHRLTDVVGQKRESMVNPIETAARAPPCSRLSREEAASPRRDDGRLLLRRCACCRTLTSLSEARRRCV
jgi:hypothetical protein